MDGARIATAADGPVVVELARRGIAELSANRGGDIWRRREAHAEPFDVDLTARCAHPGADDRAVVGTIDDTVVGYGLARLEDLHDGDRLAVVSDLYVEPEARGVGVGEAIMDLLVAWATEAGAIGIDALALPGDRHTKNFFETFGLTARAILVHRDLRPAGAGT